MTILLFGVTNVGKSTVGEMLADKLGFVYSVIENKYDMNNESPDEVVDGIIKKFRLAQ